MYYSISRTDLYLYACSVDDCWNPPCEYSPNRGSSVLSDQGSMLAKLWLLTQILAGAAPSSPLSKILTGWKDYYEWRCIPLDSPVALLLHWV